MNHYTGYELLWLFFIYSFWWLGIGNDIGNFESRESLLTEVW